MRRSKGTAIVERWWRIEEVVHVFRRRKKAAVEGGENGIGETSLLL